MNKKSFFKYLTIFIVLNFGALGFGTLLSGEGAFSEWYQLLNKAPWTPPGWVFGAAWSCIMICFSFFMAILFTKRENKNRLIVIYMLQWILNVSWNPAFFYFHNSMLGLIIIFLLSGVVAYFLFGFLQLARLYALLTLPYFIWIIIATSLNMYIVIFN